MSGQAIFLSYASQDADAARRICEALRAAGLEVWFDQSELRGGDAWDASIRKQIKECALFVPIISNNTQEREEGYFRLEWKLAVDRSHLMADDKAFFFPVVLDDVAEAKARVPDKFRERQWTPLKEERAVAAFAARVAKLIAGSGVSGKSASNGARTLATTQTPVIPAQAGIQVFRQQPTPHIYIANQKTAWIPACAGMTALLDLDLMKPRPPSRYSPSPTAAPAPMTNIFLMALLMSCSMCWRR